MPGQGPPSEPSLPGYTQHACARAMGIVKCARGEGARASARSLYPVRRPRPISTRTRVGGDTRRPLKMLARGGCHKGQPRCARRIRTTNPKTHMEPPKTLTRQRHSEKGEGEHHALTSNRPLKPQWDKYPSGKLVHKQSRMDKAVSSKLTPPHTPKNKNKKNTKMENKCVWRSWTAGKAESGL